jgi:hypothetical protein
LQKFLPDEETSAEISPAEHDPQPTRTSVGTASTGTSPVRHAEDVDIPTNKIWTWVAAHESRFCWEHGQDEWLLEFEDSLVCPGDFDVSEAEVKLEKMLQGYQQDKVTSKRKPAECDSDLWSEVDTPVKYDEIRGYLIRWKRRWTLESDIGDLEQVKASYTRQNAAINRRCSDRVEKNSKAMMASRERTMVVVNLEDLLVEE